MLKLRLESRIVAAVMCCATISYQGQSFSAEIKPFGTNIIKHDVCLLLFQWIIFHGFHML